MEDDSWYVNSTDLQFYKDKIEIDQAGGWQLMMEKEVPNLMLYKAWRRTLPVSDRITDSFLGYM